VTCPSIEPVVDDCANALIVKSERHNASNDMVKSRMEIFMLNIPFFLTILSLNRLFAGVAAF
jgi:hypothetical protein